MLDPKAAPEGFVAVLKSAVTNQDENICRQCDWHPSCNGLMYALRTGKWAKTARWL